MSIRGEQREIQEIEEKKSSKGRELNTRDVYTRISELTSRVTENSEILASLVNSHDSLQALAVKTRDNTSKLTGTMLLLNKNQKSMFTDLEPLKQQVKEMALRSQSERVFEKPKEEMAFEIQSGIVIDKSKQECTMDQIMLKIIEINRKMDTNHEELKNLIGQVIAKIDSLENRLESILK